MSLSSHCITVVWNMHTAHEHLGALDRRLPSGVVAVAQRRIWPPTATKNTHLLCGCQLLCVRACVYA